MFLYYWLNILAWRWWQTIVQSTTIETSTTLTDNILVVGGFIFAFLVSCCIVTVTFAVIHTFSRRIMRYIVERFKHWRWNRFLKQHLKRYPYATTKVTMTMDTSTATTAALTNDSPTNLRKKNHRSNKITSAGTKIVEIFCFTVEATSTTLATIASFMRRPIQSVGGLVRNVTIRNVTYATTSTIFSGTCTTSVAPSDNSTSNAGVNIARATNAAATPTEPSTTTPISVLRNKNNRILGGRSRTYQYQTAGTSTGTGSILDEYTSSNDNNSSNRAAVVRSRSVLFSENIDGRIKTKQYLYDPKQSPAQATVMKSLPPLIEKAYLEEKQEAETSRTPSSITKSVSPDQQWNSHRQLEQQQQLDMRQSSVEQQDVRDDEENHQAQEREQIQQSIMEQRIRAITLSKHSLGRKTLLKQQLLSEKNNSFSDNERHPLLQLGARDDDADSINSTFSSTKSRKRMVCTKQEERNIRMKRMMFANSDITSSRSSNSFVATDTTNIVLYNSNNADNINSLILAGHRPNGRIPIFNNYSVAAATAKTNDLPLTKKRLRRYEVEDQIWNDLNSSNDSKRTKYDNTNTASITDSIPSTSTQHQVPLVAVTAIHPVIGPLVTVPIVTGSSSNGNTSSTDPTASTGTITIDQATTNTDIHSATNSTTTNATVAATALLGLKPAFQFGSTPENTPAPGPVAGPVVSDSSGIGEDDASSRNQNPQTEHQQKQAIPFQFGSSVATSTNTSTSNVVSGPFQFGASSTGNTAAVVEDFTTNSKNMFPSNGTDDGIAATPNIFGGRLDASVTNVTTIGTTTPVAGFGQQQQQQSTSALGIGVSNSASNTVVGGFSGTAAGAPSTTNGGNGTGSFTFGGATTAAPPIFSNVGTAVVSGGGAMFTLGASSSTTGARTSQSSTSRAGSRRSTLSGRRVLGRR